MSAYDTGALELARPQQIPSLDERIRYAEALADASLLPAAYRARPANVLVAIETGHMLGIAPMAALHNIHIVEGKPTLSAALMAALVRRAGHKLRVQLSEDGKKARAQLIRADDPEFTYEAVWTMQRAETAKLLGKDVWQKYPASMLKNRATSEVCRDGAQDVFLGPVYVPEELGADVDAEGNPTSVDVPDSARQIDWDANLAELEGDREGLWQLGELAKQYGESVLPEGFRDRYRAAWERAKQPQRSADAEIVEDQDAAEADPDGGAELCPGTSTEADARGETVISGESGELALCLDCQQWTRLHNGRHLPHPKQAAGGAA